MLPRFAIPAFVSGSVFCVFGTRCPLQIRYLVVCLVAVFMIDLWFIFRIWNEGYSNETVDSLVFPFDFDSMISCLFWLVL